MVGEAIRQISGGIEEHIVRSVVVVSALIIQPTRTSEVIIRLPRHQLTKKNDSSWWDSFITFNNGNGWTSNCLGQVKSGGPIEVRVPEMREYLGTHAKSPAIGGTIR